MMRLLRQGLVLLSRYKKTIVLANLIVLSALIFLYIGGSMTIFVLYAMEL